MDLEHISGTTTAFYTLNACDGHIAMEVSKVLSMDNIEQQSSWKILMENNPSLLNRLIEQGFNEAIDFSSINIDYSILLFTCSIHIDSDKKPIAIGDNLTRERFGRFPCENGSMIAYLLQYLRPNSKIENSSKPFEEIIILLKKLYSFNKENDYSNARYDSGQGGMNILGFLTFEEVVIMRKFFAGRYWSVSSDEPLDGGVRDAIKHLTSMLKSAERRDSGIIHRSHQ